MRLARLLIWIVVTLIALAAVSGAGWIAYRTWPRKLPRSVPQKVPKIFIQDGNLGIAMPTEVLVADVGDYHHRLAAFLYFNFLRTRSEVDPHRILLCTGPSLMGSNPKIFLLLDNDTLSSVPYLGSLISGRLIQNFSLHGWTYADLAACQKQSPQIEADFRPPPALRLNQIPDNLLIDPLAEFIVFKASTDRRLLTRAVPSPLVPSFDQAREFAQDAIVVARFYSLPLDYFLGIAAMENNYMSVRGDLDRAVWKRRPQRGDIVLRRWHHRVLVRNYSLGIWQIQLETLRYAQLLYLRDRYVRDYSSLPENLRPVLLQDPAQVQPETMTTYAGLIFRNLLDRFHENIMEAVGAYNGGTQDPNPAYADSVRVIAQYLHRVVIHSVALHPTPYAPPVRDYLP